MRTAAGVRDYFNLHYDNILSGISPGLNDYEISMYLTQAHREVVYNYYMGDTKGDSFDSSEKTRAFLSYYIKRVSLTKFTPTLNPPTTDLIYKDCVLDDNIWFVAKESITLISGKQILVKPVSHDEFWIIVEDPYKKPNGQRAWRLDISTDSKRTSILVSSKEFTAYNLTYLTKTPPFILSNLNELEEGLTIEGSHEMFIPQSLQENELLMDAVINRAVELATRDYKQNTLETQIQLNNRTE